MPATSPSALAIAEGPGPTVLFLVADVAAMTRISKRRILDACRSGELDHVHAGGRRLMSQQQIDAMVAHFSTGVTKPAAAKALDGVAAVLQASRRNAARQTPRRAAA